MKSFRWLLRPVRRVGTAVRRAASGAAIHERILFIYVLGLLLAVLRRSGERSGTAAFLLATDLLLLSAAIVAVRAPLVVNRFAAALLARLVVFGGLVGTFLQLDVVLTAARRGTFDTTLYAIDLRLFGSEPAEVFDRWVSPPTTEWFSFFYVSYFALLAIHVVPFMFLERRLGIVAEFALGMVTLYCVGQLTYVLVPGFGPYRTLAFAHTLEGGTWWRMVQSGAVAINESTRTDIFPSLHTAGPTFIGLFSFRHRAYAPFTYTWPLVAFFSSQIIIATMFLRWHYLIDVLAGLSLAAFAVKMASYAAVEGARRAQAGVPPVWTALELRDLFAVRTVAVRDEEDQTDARS